MVSLYKDGWEGIVWPARMTTLPGWADRQKKKAGSFRRDSRSYPVLKARILPFSALWDPTYQLDEWIPAPAPFALLPQKTLLDRVDKLSLDCLLAAILHDDRYVLYADIWPFYWPEKIHDFFMSFILFFLYFGLRIYARIKYSTRILFTDTKLKTERTCVTKPIT